MPTPPGRHRPPGAGTRRPTIDDVAAAAGVSRGTVSRALTGGRYVSAAAAAAVRRAVLETGYVVNSQARSLATDRAGAVAFVLSEPQERLFEDPNFSVLLRSCTQALADRDMTMTMVLAGTGADRARVARYTRSGHVDGLLLVSTHGDDPVLRAAVASGLPVVTSGKPVGHERDAPYVAADDRGGARAMTEHLLGLGRRRVAMVTGPQDTSGGLDRLAGYLDVMGRRARTELVEEAADYSQDAGDRAMAALLARVPDLDAAFVASDLLAAGALGALRRAGRDVPGDVAVGGFDDSTLATTVHPPLTTVHQPLERAGRLMVDLLLRRVAGEEVGPVVLPTELVVRRSA